MSFLTDTNGLFIGRQDRLAPSWTAATPNGTFQPTERISNLFEFANIVLMAAIPTVMMLWGMGLLR